MCERCCTPKADTDLPILRRARDTARRAGRRTIRRPDISEAERHLGLTMSAIESPRSVTSAEEYQR